MAVGDAENDHAFMRASGFSVAVANALQTIKDEADLITHGARGAGVTELIESIIVHDAEAFGSVNDRIAVEVGVRPDGRPVTIHPLGGGALIAGLSGGGKSTVATALLERFLAAGFQVCVFDPEGDYAHLNSVAVVGDAKAPPQLSGVTKVLERPLDSVVVNMLAVSVGDRPALFSRFISAIAELRARTGRPHWIVVDETHHVLPARRDASAAALPPALPPTLFVAVDPEAVARDALERIDDVFAVGGKADETIRVFCRAIAIQPPALPPPPNEDGQAIAWRRRSAEPPELVALHAPAQKSERHIRKYAEGALGEDKSFYFRGRANALNLRAQNLTLFIQIAGGVDDETWLHHLKAHDYSRWMREAIKDEELAAEIRQAEDSGLDTFETRRRVREAIERRYTAPADSSNG